MTDIEPISVDPTGKLADALTMRTMRTAALRLCYMACVASCTCQTKTPDPDWHLERCTYRVLSELAGRIECITDPSPAAVLAEAVKLPEVAALVGAAQKYREAIESFDGGGDLDRKIALVNAAKTSLDAALAALEAASQP